MKDYYAVFDLTPAEHDGSYILFGIGEKVDGHQLEYQEGAEVNVYYDENGKEYDPSGIKDEVIIEKPVEQESEQDTKSGKG